MRLVLIPIWLLSIVSMAQTPLRDDHRFIDQGQTMSESRVLNPLLVFDANNPPIVFYYPGEPLALNFEKEIDYCHDENKLFETYRKDPESKKVLKRIHLRVNAKKLRALKKETKGFNIFKIGRKFINCYFKDGSTRFFQLAISKRFYLTVALVDKKRARDFSAFIPQNAIKKEPYTPPKKRNRDAQIAKGKRDFRMFLSEKIHPIDK